MEESKIVIQKIILLKTELENLENIKNSNIIFEINNLIYEMDESIEKIKDNINDINKYNKEKLKNNIILRIFMPYIIYLSSIITDNDLEQLLISDNLLKEILIKNNLLIIDKNFIKEILKKYIEK
jgi:hypothetical protein